MKNKKNFVLVWILLYFVSSACGLIQADNEKKITQIAQNILNTQTSIALSWTPTHTASPTFTLTPSATASATPTPTSSPTPSRTPTATRDPAILFSDDFSNPNSGWFEYSGEDGEMMYSDGGFRINIKSAHWFYWSTPERSYTNVIIDVDVRKISGPINNEYGVICRYMDRSNFYIFSISSDGYYGIFKIVDDEWNMIQDIDWRFNDKVIKTGAGTNHMRITCDGENLSLEVNGSILMDVNDSDLKAGDVGLYAGVYDAPGLEVLFDNFIVRRP